MKMHLNTIREIKKSVTDYPLSLTALVLLAQKSEEWLATKIEEAVALLEKENELGKIQGLRPKHRITDELILQVVDGGK